MPCGPYTSMRNPYIHCASAGTLNKTATRASLPTWTCGPMFFHTRHPSIHPSHQPPQPRLADTGGTRGNCNRGHMIPYDATHGASHCKNPQSQQEVYLISCPRAAHLRQQQQVRPLVAIAATSTTGAARAASQLHPLRPDTSTCTPGAMLRPSAPPISTRLHQICFDTLLCHTIEVLRLPAFPYRPRGESRRTPLSLLAR